ncbi:MAG: HD domain-containing protein [Chitinivibrionales bacterium]|nr:HD domain-containing protein [Chitinivibrionales bacterium]
MFQEDPTSFGADGHSLLTPVVTSQTNAAFSIKYDRTPDRYQQKYGTVGTADKLISYLYTIFRNSQNSKLQKYVDTLFALVFENERAVLKLLNHLKNLGSDYFAHHMRVARNCAVIAHKLRLETGTTKNLLIAALAHDIGKLDLQHTLLLKKTQLTPHEFERIKDHVHFSARHLQLYNEINNVNEICATILAHHENYNGSGYPLGLSGQNIPVGARIIRIIDVYDSLLSQRVYKYCYPHKLAIGIMNKMAKDCFDPAIYKIFTANIKLFQYINCDTITKATRSLFTSNILSDRDKKLMRSSE